MDVPITLEELKDRIKTFSVSLEQRRRKYLLMFCFVFVIAIFMVTAAMFCGREILVQIPVLIHYILNALNQLLGGSGIDEYGAYNPSFLEGVALKMFVLFFAIVAVFLPIYKYRGRNSGIGMVPSAKSLKDDIYSRLVMEFGDFQYAPDAGGALKEIYHSKIILDYELFHAEDYIRGVVNDCTVRMVETKIVQVRHGNKRAAFNGLLVIVDTSEVRVKLRKPHDGHTVIIADAQKDLLSINKKFKDFERVTLDDLYESRFEMFSTNALEAKWLSSPKVLDIVLLLHDKLQGLKLQKQHWDDRLAHATNAVIHWEPRRHSRQLPSEREYANTFGHGVDVTKADCIMMEVAAINRSVQIECFDDKIIVTVPTAHDLFEVNSLFEPALNEEDAEVLHLIMTLLFKITAITEKPVAA